MSDSRGLTSRAIGEGCCGSYRAYTRLASRRKCQSFGLPWQDAAMIHGRAALGVFGCPFWRFLSTKLSDKSSTNIQHHHCRQAHRHWRAGGVDRAAGELYLSHNVIENAHGLESQVSSEDCWLGKGAVLFALTAHLHDDGKAVFCLGWGVRFRIIRRQMLFEGIC